MEPESIQVSFNSSEGISLNFTGPVVTKSGNAVQNEEVKILALYQVDGVDHFIADGLRETYSGTISDTSHLYSKLIHVIAGDFYGYGPEGEIELFNTSGVKVGTIEVNLAEKTFFIDTEGHPISENSSVSLISKLL